MTVLPQLFDGQSLGQVCDSLSASSNSDASRSTLTVQCIVSGSEKVGKLWGLVSALELAFLLP